MNKIICLLALLLISNSVYAHGLTATAAAMILFPVMLACVAFIVASTLLLMNKPSKKWYLISLGFFIFQAVSLIGIQIIEVYLS